MTKNLSHWLLMYCVFPVFLVFLGSVLSPGVLAQQGQAGPTGDLSVVGEVTVNGTIVETGAIVSSGSTVQTTGQNSSAVVSLGKLGRVVVEGNSLIQLFYNVRQQTFSIMIDAGSVRVSTGARAEATVRRRERE